MPGYVGRFCVAPTPGSEIRRALQGIAAIPMSLTKRWLNGPKVMGIKPSETMAYLSMRYAGERSKLRLRPTRAAERRIGEELRERRQLRDETSRTDNAGATQHHVTCGFFVSTCFLAQE